MKADASSEFGYRKRASIWSKINQWLCLIIVVIVGVPLLYSRIPVVQEKEAQDAHAAELEEKIDKARMQHARLTSEVRLLERNDPEYLSLFIRDNLSPGYMKPGETIFRMEPQGKGK